jgi:hypothetical protein
MLFLHPKEKPMRLLKEDAVKFRRQFRRDVCSSFVDCYKLRIRDPLGRGSVSLSAALETRAQNATWMRRVKHF